MKIVKTDFYDKVEKLVHIDFDKKFCIFAVKGRKSGCGYIPNHNLQEDDFSSSCVFYIFNR